MSLSKAIELQKQYWMHGDCNPTHFIEWLYRKGYIIVDANQYEMLLSITVTFKENKQ